MMWITNLKKEVVDADPDLVEKLRQSTVVYWEAACGLKPGVQLTKDEFIDRMSKFCSSEATKQHPLVFDYLEALYNVTDTNHDGFLSLEEYQKMLKASNFDASAAKIAFDMIDENHDGKLSREEMKKHVVGFWFNADDKETAGMYGAKFE